MRKTVFSGILATFTVLCFLWILPMGVSAVDFPYGINDFDQYPFDDGDGTMDYPYLISTPQQFAQLAYNVAHEVDYQNEYIRVTANLDLTGLDWIPIGTSATEAFMGHFDGNNKVISNLTIGNSVSPSALLNTGIFGYVADAEIHHVIIENATIYIAIPSGYGDIGVLAGKTTGTVISLMQKLVHSHIS